MARAATVGMFDGVHLGHKRVVEQLCTIALSRGLKPMVVTFDRHPLCHINPVLAPKMLSTVEQKSRLLVNYGAEEVVVMRFDDALRNLTAGEFMTMLHDRYDVELLLVGHDHRFGRGRAESFDDYCRIGEACGVNVVREDELVLPGTGLPLCSSSVRKALSDGDLALATTLLGHDFSIHGRVGHGRNIGHTIGFPTANLLPFLSDQQLPAPGVYAGIAEIQGGQRYQAMINIGTNPTVSGDGEIKIEAHLIGYAGDLYDTILSLTFTRRLRDERKFPSLEALKAQLQADCMGVAEKKTLTQGRWK